MPGAAPLLSDETLDLALLISCLPKAHYGWLMAALPSLAASAPQPYPPVGKPAVHPGHISPSERQRGRLDWLRARLRDEMAAGLSIVVTPLWQMSRARRNQALVVRAETMGRLAEALGRCPGADLLEQELERALAQMECYISVGPRACPRRA